MLRRLAAAIGLVSARRHALAEERIHRLEARIRELKTSVDAERAKNHTLSRELTDISRRSKNERAKSAPPKSSPDRENRKHRRSEVAKADRQVLEALAEAHTHLEFVSTRLKNSMRRS